MTKPNSKLYIAEASVLPEVFVKVCEAKEHLETGRAATVADAVAMAGISRSAFYKYKDSVAPFRDMKRDQAITFSILIHDRPGALSAVLAIFADSGANILTINQAVPVNGVAMVTLSFFPGGMELTLDELRAKLKALPTVVRLELLAG